MPKKTTKKTNKKNIAVIFNLPPAIRSALQKKVPAGNRSEFISDLIAKELKIAKAAKKKVAATKKAVTKKVAAAKKAVKKSVKKVVAHKKVARKPMKKMAKKAAPKKVMPKKTMRKKKSVFGRLFK